MFKTNIRSTLYCLFLAGFYDEVMRRFSIKLFREFCQMFDWMPLAARINCKIFCVHGGLSPHLHRLTQIDEIERPTEVPSYGLMCDLLWSDPVEDVNGWSENGSRNISYQFGPDLVKKFCEKHHLDLVVRAHQARKIKLILTLLT